jgi:hypothetical protein
MPLPGICLTPEAGKKRDSHPTDAHPGRSDDFVVNGNNRNRGRAVRLFAHPTRPHGTHASFLCILNAEDAFKAIRCLAHKIDL